MYYGGISRDGNGCIASIWKNINGVWTQLASRRINSCVGVLRFDVVGSNLSLYFNNELVVSVVDFSIAGPGKIGLRFYGIGATANAFSYQIACSSNNSRGATAFCSSDTIICNGVESRRDPKNNCGCPCIDIRPFVPKPAYTTIVKEL